MGYGTTGAAIEWGGRESERDYGFGAELLEGDEHLDADALETLGDEIALMAAHATAFEHAMLRRIARFDRDGGWEAGGHRSCAHWLSFRIGMCLPAARERCRVAAALADLPLTSAAMARGALSFSKARAITRIAKPETEADLLELAENVPAAQLEIMVRAWKVNSRLEETELARQRHLARRLSIYPENGMYALHGLMTAEGGGRIRTAVDAEMDRIYRERGSKGVPPDAEAHTEAARLRADALVRLVERGAAAAASGSRSGSRPGGTELVLHVDADTLSADGEPGMSELEDGTRVSAATARRLACDAGIVTVTHAPDGSILDVGRKSRSVTAAIRRALDARDGHCRFPGCFSRHTQPHHLHHWVDGGKTALKNTLLLCRFHHRLVHEGGWTVRWWNERGERSEIAFTDLRGQTHVGGAPPKPPELAEGEDATGAVVAANLARGVRPDAWTVSARWKRERDIPDGVRFRAIEAGMS
jgi:hypothetical protein